MDKQLQEELNKQNEELKKLKQEKKQGTITSQEFMSKRKEILDRRLKTMQEMNTPEERKKNWKRAFKIEGIIILIFLIFFGVILSVENINTKIEKSKEVQMPNVVEMTYEEAKEELSNLGLVIELTSGSSDNKDSIVTKQETKKGDTLKKGDTVQITTKTQEEIEAEEEKKREEAAAKAEAAKIKADNVEVGKTITSTNSTSVNKSTMAVCGIITYKYENVYPNMQWTEIEVREADGYGRFWVYMKFLKTPNAETYSSVHEIVWLVDEDNFGIFTTIGNIYDKKTQAKWGTEIDN